MGLLSWPGAAAGQDGVRGPVACAAPATEMRRAALAVHDKQRNVGVAVAVTRNSQPAFSLIAGSADLEHDVPVTPETRFGVASLTKLYTAVALLQLREAGRVDLDAPVQRYVPAYPVHAAGTITVRMLATHRSGIPHLSRRTPELFATHYVTATDALEVFAHDTLVARPGTRRVYSSSNYNLIAAVIEAVAGEPFPGFVRRTLLEPLHLAATEFDNPLRLLPHRAERYSVYHPWTYAAGDSLFIVPRWDYSFNQGGGNLSAAAADVAAFGTALLSPGLLSAASLELLYDDAWFGSHDGEGDRMIYTTGSNPGVQAGLVLHPATGIVSVVLSNTWGVGSRSAEMVRLARVLARQCAAEREATP
jgi:serine beta-lactamase-like protein LACTB, mitochondrial